MRYLSLLLVLLPCLYAMPFDHIVHAGAGSSGAYSDAIARKQMLYMSAAAYSSKPATCIDNTWKNATLKRQYEVNCDITSLLTKDKCSGFTAVSHDDKAIIVAFRGTNKAFELAMEVEETLFDSMNTWYTGGEVAKYFYDGFSDIWKKGMKDDFLSLQSKYSTYQVWVTGHSLGGALASLASSYISYMKYVTPDKIQLYTFGQPRTGDTAFATAHDKDVKYSYRVTHNRDMVPHIPLKSMHDYHHHMEEVFYKESMAAGAKYILCADYDENAICSDGNLIPDISIKDHLHYFEVDVSDFGAKGCQ